MANGYSKYSGLMNIWCISFLKPWIETWDKFEALGAKTVIPGHGGQPTWPPCASGQATTLCTFEKVAEVIGKGGSLDDDYKADQSADLHLHTADELASSNTGRVYRVIEFE
jgi:hypothetical protein